MSGPSGRKLFGTDGIRGNADADLTPDLVREIARAVAVACRQGVLGRACDEPTIVVGRDTRLSGPKLERAFVEGACSAGADVRLAGVVPTPGVAYLTASLASDAGVVISASHNPPQDNGIKLFGPGGWKLTAVAEDRIEGLVGSGTTLDARPGTSVETPEVVGSYIDHLTTDIAPGLAGRRVVVDCANGAASAVAPEVMRRAGIDVVALNDSLDGAHINEGCGALYPEVVCEQAGRRAAIGVTFDGDADRVLLADERGRLVGGDAVLALIASRMKREGRLSNDTVAITVMANQALRRWCADEAIDVVETAVGDRYLLEAMREEGIVLGGEQSGHIICLDRSTTGDGMLVALEVLDLVAESGSTLGGIVPFEPFPQVLVNVPTTAREHVEDFDGVRAAIADAESRLGSAGRVLVRPSGTEPLVRVMVEATDASLAGRVAADVAAVVRRELNGA